MIEQCRRSKGTDRVRPRNMPSNPAAQTTVNDFAAVVGCLSHLLFSYGCYSVVLRVRELVKMFIQLAIGCASTH